MKNIQITALVFGLALSASAMAKEFDLKIESKLDGSEKSFVLGVTTTEIHSSMCALTLTGVQINQRLAPLEQDMMLLHDLALSFNSNPHAMCLTAFGPHRGSAEFDIGRELPKLDGLYNLVINGEDYGILRVGAEGAVLEVPPTE